MSLSAREQKVLEQIGRELADSDPHLASLMFRFTWLAADEALPAREEVSAGWWQLIRPGRGPRRRHGGWMRPTVRRPRPFPRWRLVWPLLWLMTSIALVAVALAVGHGAGQGACAGRAPACAGQMPSSALHTGHKPAAGVG